MVRRLIITGLIVIFSLPGKAFSELSISVTPYEGGGSNLNFGRVSPPSVVNKEVRIKIISSRSGQYQVRQRLLEPLKNEEGVKLNEGALSSYTLRGSNLRGSLYQETPQGLRILDDILYVSNPQGDSDSFVVVYTFDGRKVNVLGRFSGKILYTLQPLRGGNPQTFILNVSLDIESKFSIEVDTSSLGKMLKLSTKSEDTQKGYIKFNILGNIEEKLDVFQNIESLPRSDKGDIFPLDNFKFFVSGDSEIYFNSPTTLERKPLKICSLKQVNSQFQVNFLMDKKQLEDLEAGLYRGRLVYSFQGSKLSKVMPVDLEIEVSRIFDIQVESEYKGKIYFSNVKPNLPPQEKAVIIKVRSNLGKPYQVVQRVSFPLTNEKGDKIPSQFFTLKEELLKEERGTVKYTTFAALKQGEDVIFTSDDKGSSSSFRVIYRLNISPDLPSGSYFTNIDYTLVER